jgi:hypothetical protein
MHDYILVHVMKAYWGSSGIAPRILHPCIRWGEYSTSCSEKEPPYPFSMGLTGPQNRCGRFGEKKNLLLLSHFEPWMVKTVPYATIPGRSTWNLPSTPDVQLHTRRVFRGWPFRIAVWRWLSSTRPPRANPGPGKYKITPLPPSRKVCTG